MDTAFGDNGRTLVTKVLIQNYMRGKITATTDGKILVAGGSDGKCAVARYNADGSLDTAFGDNGKAVAVFGWYAHTATIDSQGRIVLIGNDLGPIDSGRSSGASYGTVQRRSRDYQRGADGGRRS